MGPEPLILDHALFYDLWRDPYFWEHAPRLEDDRDAAEALAAHKQSPFIIKSSPLYNQWLELLRDWVVSDPDSVRRFVAYIQQKRRCATEPILLAGNDTHPELVTLYSGVAPWRHDAFD